MMGRFLLLIVLCVALAVLRAVIIAALALAALALIFSFITRPKQTLVFLGTLALAALTVAQPTAFIVTLGVVALTAVIVDLRRKPQHGVLLTDGRQHRPPEPEKPAWYPP